MIYDVLLTPPRTLRCKDKLLTLETPKVMGVLNVTPDSFFDGGHYAMLDDALRQTDKMLTEGASIIDIGGQSTRPAAQDVGVEEELRRVIPVIEAITQRFPDVIVSVDTYRSRVAIEAVDAGAGIVNDISGGNIDPQMFETVSRLQVPYILMHIQGTPENMQTHPIYNNVVTEVFESLHNKVQQLRALEVYDVVVDPGFGFGKNIEHNYALLKHLNVFATMGAVLLAGVSRKSMINKVLGTTPHSALNGTTVLNTIALLNGAQILRVHDVKEAMEAITLVGMVSTGLINYPHV